MGKLFERLKPEQMKALEWYTEQCFIQDIHNDIKGERKAISYPVTSYVEYRANALSDNTLQELGAAGIANIEARYEQSKPVKESNPDPTPSPTPKTFRPDNGRGGHNH